ncbi:SDR family NAD(P)-dependent oxidoreductase [Rhizobium wenxiniae]|nr:SDR family NAD(P)-dependent oxidoreductase [Rhizobium wenxiniae]
MSARPTKLQDLVVVIAGASSGFGRGAAEQLARNGAKVVIAATEKHPRRNRQRHYRRW